MNLQASGFQANNATQKKKPLYANAVNENAFLSIDDALEYAGDNSRYQKRVNTIFSLQYVIYSILFMGFPLLLVKPTFYCRDDSGDLYPCKEKEACEMGNFTVDDNGEKTLTSEFQLYCDRSWINGLLGSLLFFGSFIATFIFPYIGNNRGRKFGITLANIMSATSALVVGLSPDIYVIMVFLVVGGVAFSGFETLCYVYTSEVSGERFRNYSAVTLGTVWSFIQIFIAPMFLIVNDWRYVFILYMAVPWFLSLPPNIRMVYETPRFLNLKMKYTKAREVINKICKINQRQPFKAKLYGEIDFENARSTTLLPPRQPRVSRTPHVRNLGYTELFRQPQLRKTTLVLLYIWFFRNVTYFGLNYALPQLGTEVYQNFTLTAVSETLANVFAAKIKFAMGRIKSLYLSITLVSAACLLIFFFPIPDECYLDQNTCYQKTASVFFAVVAKFCIGLFANILVTYTSESYPTDVRSLGMGLTMTASRIGTIAMPFIVTAMEGNQFSPLVLFGLMGIVAFAMIVWCLPETYGMLMTELMIELQNREEPLLNNQELEDSFDGIPHDNVRPTVIKP